MTNIISLQQNKVFAIKKRFYTEIFFFIQLEFNQNKCDKIKKKKKIEFWFWFILLVLKISYWRATTIAPIKATKRIIEISSNGRKKSVDK